MSQDMVILEKKDGVATITLNRPERLNAITVSMLKAFEGAIHDLTSDDEVNVVVITGAGRAFCAGEDVKEAPNEEVVARVSSKRGVLAIDNQATFPRLMRSMPKPVIAAVNGPAVGQGLSICLACDIRLASEEAKFSAMFVHRGIPPESGSGFNLPRIVGIAKACELIFTGRMIDAKEAKEIGLVNHVFPAHELMPRTMEMATCIAQGPPIAIGIAKQLLYHGLETNNITTYLERDIFCLSYCFQTEDREEGIRSFLEKRPPKFKGR